MEVTSPNPLLSMKPKPIGTSPIFAKIVRARVPGAKQEGASYLPGGFSRLLAALHCQLSKCWQALVRRTRPAPRSLSVSESASLGERRTVSVVQFERQRFLIGCGPSSVTFLACLPDAGPGGALDPPSSANAADAGARQGNMQ